MLASSSDLHRDAFFFASGDATLYGSLVSPPGPVQFGMVVVPSIGPEAAQSLDPAHALASAAAAWGGAGMVVHPPGSLDSTGDAEALTIDAFARAVRDAAGALRARVPFLDLCLVGFRFGAAAALLAAGKLEPSLVVALAPTPDPSAAVEELRRDSERATFGRGGDAAFGHSVPRSIGGADAPGRIAAAMARMGSRLVVVRFTEPPMEGLPAAATDVVVPGTLGRFRIRWASHLARPAESAIEERMAVRE
ncbi:MAG TPA: hypothetical protein VNN79_23440 [Actinomycetota bacterium]|nr:hypothetical protein [Actinomycetota bacterium]